MDSRRCPNSIPQNIDGDRVTLFPVLAQCGIRRSHRADSVGDRSTVGLAPTPSSIPPPNQQTIQSSLSIPDSKTEHAASPVCFH